MIRRLTVEDIDAFRALREEAMRLHPESFGSPEEEQGGEKQETAYRHWLKESDIWGAFEGENLIGATGFYIPPSQHKITHAQIFTVYVRAAYRGKGIGDTLLKLILALTETRVNQAHLCVVHTAEAAIRAYRRHGFEICGTDKGSLVLDGKSYDELLMVKKFR